MMIFFNLHKRKLMIPEGSSCIRAVFSGGENLAKPVKENGISPIN